MEDLNYMIRKCVQLKLICTDECVSPKSTFVKIGHMTDKLYAIVLYYLMCNLTFVK